MRGTPDTVHQRRIKLGIIPACAGNTMRVAIPVRGNRDHPRVCGEHFTCHGIYKVRQGSSPRVRGTLVVCARYPGLPGIIPACAGNTIRKCSISLCHGDHPRVCGEHPFREGVHVAVRGSSPRVRGTRFGLFARRTRTGIIPACAGNTIFREDSESYRRDHPRVCGEHPPLHPYAGQGKGSSPRVRGTRDDFVRKIWRHGIIPACAGNTWPPVRAGGICWDHPRVCGEHRRLQ